MKNKNRISRRALSILLALAGLPPLPALLEAQQAPKAIVTAAPPDQPPAEAGAPDCHFDRYENVRLSAPRRTTDPKAVSQAFLSWLGRQSFFTRCGSIKDLAPEYGYLVKGQS